MKKFILFLLVILFPFSLSSNLYSFSESDLSKIQLPDGFNIEVYAKVPNARGMALSDEGTLFVGTRQLGKVFAVTDIDKDFKADEVVEIASGFNMPVGVEVYKGDLYFSSVSSIYKISDIEKNLKNTFEPELITSRYPEDLSHGWKFIKVGPDGFLYIPVGAPCNICEREDPYASITRMKPDGSEYEVYVRGVRNTVGFDWHPETGELWFTDNGRDWLGDDLPPCELNRVERPGEHFGYPYCHGGFLKDPKFGDKRECSEFKSPAQNLGPHVAPLGMRFYRGDMFPSEYQNQVFIAERGSWNRSKKIGYRVMLVKVKNGKSMGYEVFADGWLQPGEKVLGRPVDILNMPDGSLLVSDDFSGTIYRITYSS